MSKDKISRAEKKRSAEFSMSETHKIATKKDTSNYVYVPSPNLVIPKAELSEKEQKRLNTLAIETEKLKKDLIVQLRKTPIVQIACERTGVGRSTYYEWRRRDHIFARAADRGREAGRFFINDLAESKLLQLIKDGNLTAIIFWLKHNDPKFATVNRIIHEYETATVKPSIEEENIVAQEIAKMASSKLKSQFTTEDFKERIEEEIKEAEQNQESNKRLRSFEDDSGDR